MNQLPSNPSESFKRRNPHIYGLGRLVSEKPESVSRPALDMPRTKRERGKGKVAVIITIIAFCHREADDDNNVASLKPLRDAIASTLRIDDGDKRIRWEYGQQETKGRQGVIVKIEPVNRALK